MRFDIEHIPNTLYLADQVRELDRIAIQEYGIAGFELMSKAARFAFHAMIRFWPKTENILVLCGAGNNAGDGYVLASIAKKKGLSVQVVALSGPAKLTGDAQTAYQDCVRAQTPISLFEELKQGGFSKQLNALPKDSVIVDAIFGTGLCRPVSGDHLKVIQSVNAKNEQALHAEEIDSTGIKILAIDIPSGLSANTGQVLGACLKADLTATFIGNKLGLMTGKGRHYSGTLVFDDLDVPATAYEGIEATAFCPQLGKLRSALGPRTMHSHKGKQGRALLIGGNTGFAGAILLASQACARTGAGLTSVITKAEHCSSVVLNQPEIMAHSATSPDAPELFACADVIGIGPGLGQDAWAYQLLEKSLKQNGFKVLDADALNLLAKHPELSALIDDQTVLTPHPGEAARLLETSAAEIERDRLSSVRALQKTFGCHIILKGSGTLIAHPHSLSEPEISLSRYGNPGMASGGMGDTLTGILCAIIAQMANANTPKSTSRAIELAVCLHSAAADIEANQHGERGLLASDLPNTARTLLNDLV
ncbi:hypothetical protein A3758_01685 [Oleiphilus sp. HI0118]|nr:hypothetical protein A3758_01685 [Oleiphilus sp. HI0118]